MSFLSAPKIPFPITVHGHTRIDDYYWMREKENPAVIQYLEAENSFCDLALEPVKELRETLFNEIKNRIKQTDMSVPYKLDDYFYYSRFEEGKEYSFQCRKPKSLDAPEQIILNVNALAEGKDFCSVSGLKISKNHRLLAYGEDFVGVICGHTG